MGFFAPDVVEKPAEQKRPVGRAPKAAKGFDNNARGCDNCALKANWSWVTTSRMPLSGNTRNPDILILGENPDEEDDKKGITFIGAAGNRLRRAIPGRELERCAFVHMTRCRVRNDARPSAHDVHSCSTHLEDDIARLPIKAIIGIGPVPLARFFPGAQITRMHGLRFPVQIGGKILWYYPIFAPSYIEGTGGDRSAALPQLKADVKRFFAEVDRWGAPRIWKPDPDDVLLPKTLEDAQEILDAMQGRLGIDIETTGLRFAVKDAQILTAAISDGEITMSFACAHPEAPTDWGLDFLLHVLEHYKWVPHNAVFELVWLLHARNQKGLTFEPAHYEDSMAIGRILHERAGMLGLDDMSRMHLGADFKAAVKVNRNNIINEPLERVLPYNGLDAQACVLLCKHLRKRLRGKDESNYIRLLNSTRSFAEMELRGLDIDIQAAKDLKEHWGGLLKEASENARTIYEVREFERVKQIEFNIGSNEHIGEALVEFGRLVLPKTNKGQGKTWSTDDQELQKYEDNPLVKAVLAYREAQRIESTYIDPVMAAYENNFDQRLHPSYTCMHTETGRPSSEAPNIQNFPKRKHREVRLMVVAPSGHIIVSFDYGQIEARGFCFATKDRQLCEDTIKGQDIHSRWRDRSLELHPDYIIRLAEKTNETEEKLILKGGRDIIKTDFVFASFFGSTARSVAERTGLPLNVAEKMLAEFWKRYPGVLAWVKAKRKEYQDTGSARTLTGMVRHQTLWGNEPLNCVDYETEALTQRGWVNGADLRAGDVLLTMSAERQMLEWQSATDVKQYPEYEGVVHRLDGKSFSVATTPNHRWAYQKDSSTDFSFYEATTETLPKWGSIPRIRPYNAPSKAAYSDDWIRLVGWVLTDGCYTNKTSDAPSWDYRRTKANGYSGSQVAVCQKKSGNIAELDALFKRLPFPSRTKLAHNRAEDEELFWTFSGLPGQWFYGNFPDRVLRPEFLLQLPKEQLIILYDTMIKGDGWIDNGREALCAGTARKDQVDAFQMLGVLCGRLTSVYYDDLTKYASDKLYPSMDNIPKATGGWVAKRTVRENVSLGWLKRSSAVEKLGMWCPMVPNTFFVARRKGKVFITGNTPIQGTTTGHMVLEAQNALAALSREKNDPYLHPRINIHDDLSFILPDDPDLLEAYIKLIAAELVKIRFDFQIVPLMVEAKVGYTWAELIECGEFIGDYIR
jgi:uracil-DNA glycosylase family 4